MENFNNVPSSGTFGSVVSVVNQNFALAKEAIDKLAFSKSACMGFYETSSELNDAHPTPTDGDWALVGDESPFNVYVANDGSWVDSGVDYNVSVDNSIEINGLGGYVVLDSVQELPASPSNPNLGYLIDTHLYVYVGTGGDTSDGKYQDCGEFRGPEGKEGKPGADGHDGVSLGEVAIVNNLTEGGTDKVLSAEMGKELGQKVGQIDNALQSQYYSGDVDLNRLTSLDGAIIKSTGKWGSSYASKHRNLPVIAGERYIISASNDLPCEYAFLETEAFAISTNPDYVLGTSMIEIGSGQKKEIIIPDGCNYLYLKEASSTGNVPTYGYLPSSVIRITTFGDRYAEIQEIIENSYREIEIESFTIKDGSLKSDGTFGSASYKHGVISVNEGERFILKNTGDTDNVRYAFATSDASSTGGNIPLVVGTNVIIVNAQRDAYIVIPSGCSYLLWNCSPSYPATLYRYKIEDVEKNVQQVIKLVGISDSGANAGVSAIGDIFYNPNDYLLYKAVSFNDSTGIFEYETVPYADAIYQCGTQLLIYNGARLIEITDAYTITLIGRGTNFITAQRLPPLEVGSKYRLIINYPYSEIALTNYGFTFYKLINGVRTTVFAKGSNKIPDYYDFTAESADYYSIGGRVEFGKTAVIKVIKLSALTDEDAVNTLIDAKIGSSPSDNSIFALNPDSDMKQKMVLIKKKTDNGASGSSTIPPLCFAHISDVHAGAEQMARYIEFANYWKQKGYIDELIDTGDVVSNTWSQGTEWRDSINGIETVITVVGNHDTRASTDEIAATDYPTGQNQWQYHSAISLDSDKRKDAYNLLMVGPDVSNPYINSWGVTQPVDAAANGLCYYYKDYANSHIRVIGIDAMGYDAAQDNWLRARLQETLNASNAAYGYHVVILTHFTGGQMVGLTCNYTSLRNTGIDYGSKYNADLSLMPISVNSFQSDGGIFVGYVIGHYHRDMINILQDYPKQLAFAVSSGGKTVLRDFTKVSGCKSYDDFQLISVNTYDYTVRLVKVGADTDYYMRKKGTVCVSYSLVKEDGKEPDAGETATKVKGVLGEGW